MKLIQVIAEWSNAGRGVFPCQLPSPHWTAVRRDVLIQMDTANWDAFVFRRWATPWQVSLMKTLKRKGKRIAWDLETAGIYHVPGPLARFVTPDALADLQACLNLADLVLVDTPEFASGIQSGKVRVCPSLTVPTNVDFAIIWKEMFDELVA